jgi:hypothetical protein
MNSYICMLGYGKYSKFSISGGYFSCRETLVDLYNEILEKFEEYKVEDIPVYFGHIFNTEQKSKQSATNCLEIIKDIITIPNIEFNLVNLATIDRLECPDKPVISNNNQWLVKASMPLNVLDISFTLLTSWYGWTVNPLARAYYILRKYGNVLPDLYIPYNKLIGKYLCDYGYANGPESFISSLNSGTSALLDTLLDKYYQDKFKTDYWSDYSNYYDEDPEDY